MALRPQGRKQSEGKASSAERRKAAWRVKRLFSRKGEARVKGKPLQLKEGKQREGKAE